VSNEGAFAAGDHAVLRHVLRGRVGWAAPVTVVRDREDLVAVYLRVGTRFMRPGTAAGTPTRDWRHYAGPVPDVWVENDFLWLMRPEDAHAACAVWRMPERQFRGWYINLQDPLRRSRFGWDTADHVLDVMVAPDLAAWAWKDEDELADRVEHGVTSEAQATAVRREGERAASRALARESPFSDGWDRWTPDPAWPMPELPPDWDIL
jgi:hypothetical protein